MAIDEQLLTAAGQQKAQRLKTVSAKGAQVQQQLDAQVTTYQTTIEQLTDPRHRQQANVGQLSQLDAAIASGRQYTEDLQQLIADLTGELDSLGQTVMTIQDATTVEKVVSFFSKTQARKMALARIREQNVEGSLKTILAYARGVVETLNRHIAENAQIYAKLQGTEQELTQKMVDTTPKLDEWRQKVKALEAEAAELQRQKETADAATLPQIQAQLASKQAELDQARINETAYSEILTNAREALPIVQAHREGFRQAIGALNQNKIKTQEKVSNLTVVFEGVYKIMETATATKGFATIDQAMNAAATSATRVMAEQVEGILATTAERAEKPLVDPQEFDATMQRFADVVNQFDQRMNNVRQASEQKR